MIEEFRYEALTTFHNLPIFAFSFADADALVRGGVPEDVEAWAWRVGTEEYDGAHADEVFPLFLETVDTTRIRALLLGAWNGEESWEGVEEFQRALLDAADRFPALEALFISDIRQELSDISFIEPHDPGKLLAAFPNLRILGMRGATDLRIEPFVHAKLEELVLQSGGLPPEVVRAVGRSDLPALSSLDLYLGVVRYGGGATAEDLDPILSAAAFPRLRHLGLRDAENADELAVTLAHAPVVAALESLDLSLGTLGDAGAAALLSGQPLTGLKRLDVHHHFMSEAMIERLRQALPGVEIDASERLEPQIDDYGDREPYRYVALAE